MVDWGQPWSKYISPRWYWYNRQSSSIEGSWCRDWYRHLRHRDWSRKWVLKYCIWCCCLAGIDYPWSTIGRTSARIGDFRPRFNTNVAEVIATFATAFVNEISTQMDTESNLRDMITSIFQLNHTLISRTLLPITFFFFFLARSIVRCNSSSSVQAWSPGSFLRHFLHVFVPHLWHAQWGFYSVGEWQNMLNSHSKSDARFRVQRF